MGRVNAFIFNTISTNSAGLDSRVPGEGFRAQDPETFMSHVSTSGLAHCPNSFVSSSTCIEVVCDLSVEYIESHFDAIHIDGNITSILDSAMSSPTFSNFFKPEKVEGLYGPWDRVSYTTVEGGKGMIVSLSSASALGLGALLFFLYRSRSESRKKLEDMESKEQDGNGEEIPDQSRGDENEDRLSLRDNSQVPEALALSRPISAESRSIELVLPLVGKPWTPVIAALKSEKRMIEEVFSSFSSQSYSSESEENRDEVLSSSSSLSEGNQNENVSGLFFGKDGNDLGQASIGKSRLYPDEATNDIEAQTPQTKAKIAKAA